MTWLKEETEKLVRFIETAPEAELDELLANSKFGSLADEKPPVAQGFVTFKMVASTMPVTPSGEMDDETLTLETSHNFKVSSPVCLSAQLSLCLSSLSDTYEVMPLAA